MYLRIVHQRRGSNFPKAPLSTRRPTLNGLVDTGASFTVVPDSILHELEIEPFDTRTFTLADGSKRDMSLGLVYMGLAGNVVPVVVVFGPDPEKTLPGAMALEAFALAADAKHHRLIPAELTL